MLRFTPTELLQRVVLLQGALLATFCCSGGGCGRWPGFLPRRPHRRAGRRGLHQLSELGAGLDVLYGPLTLALLCHLSQLQRSALGRPHV